jgi:hypothetical protein
VLPVKDWAYKAGYQIILKGTASKNMKLVLVGGQSQGGVLIDMSHIDDLFSTAAAAASSMHGNTMSTRTIIPAMKCTGFAYTGYASP